MRFEGAGEVSRASEAADFGDLAHGQRLDMCLLQVDRGMLEAGDTETALREVREALAGGPLSTRDATLHWLRSRALWALGRKEEARAARETFLSMRGDAFSTEDEDAAKVQ